MEQNKLLNVLLVGLFLLIVLSMSFVIAKKDKNDSLNDTDKNNSKNKKINYGLCVANNTKLKNDCYKTAKQDYKACNANIRELVKNTTISTTINKTEAKRMLKECRTTYKEKIKTCKANFKTARLFCVQYKCKNNETFLNGTCVKQED